MGFAEGGHIRGPGTSTSDSIPYKSVWLSDYEYITRAAVVKQPGALPFLHDFNNRGMAALQDWQQRFNGVGAPRFSMPSAPRFRFADGGLAEVAKGMGAEVNLRNYNLWDQDQLAQALAKHPAMHKMTLNVIEANPQRIKKGLGPR